MTPVNSTSVRSADSITAHVWSAGGGTGRVLVHLEPDELSSAGLQVGDDVVLDIHGAVVRGVVSEDDKGVWLGTQPLGKEWNHQRITDALRSVGITNPRTVTASIVVRNGVAASTDDPDLLRRRAVAISFAGLTVSSAPGSPTPEQTERTVVDYRRDPAVVARVLQIADGRCELCEQPAPFVREDGSPFLEVHHVVTLANGGGDTEDNAVAVCPNCHRLMHQAAESDRLSAVKKLRANVARLSVPQGDTASASGRIPP